MNDIKWYIGIKDGVARIFNCTSNSIRNCGYTEYMAFTNEGAAREWLACYESRYTSNALRLFGIRNKKTGILLSIIVDSNNTTDCCTSYSCEFVDYEMQENPWLTPSKESATAVLTKETAWYNSSVDHPSNSKISTQDKKETNQWLYMSNTYEVVEFNLQEVK